MMVVSARPLLAQNVRAALHDGFGRLAFDWKAPVKYHAEIAGRDLVITFNRPVESDTYRLVRKLRGYFEKASYSADRRRLTFRLTQDFSLRSFTIGSSIIVDIVKKDSKSKTASDKLPMLSIRAGRHSGFERLVFDWKNKTEYKLTRKNNEAVITFDRPAKINLNAVRRNLPSEFKKIKASTDKNSLSVVIPLPENKEIKHFLVGSKVIVDIIQASQPIPNIDVKSPKPAPVSTVEPEPLKATETEKLPEEKPVELKKEIEKPAKDLKKRIVSLSISWEQSVASAVFKRDDYLWIVFDRLKHIDIKLMKKTGGNILVDIIQIPHGSATVLRLITKSGYNPSLRHEGMLWIIDFMQQPFKPKATVSAVPQLRTEVGPKLFFPVSGASSVVSVVDPSVGDNMLIIPFASLGRGIFPRHEYPDAELPVTIQGIAVFAKNPNIKFTQS